MKRSAHDYMILGLDREQAACRGHFTLEGRHVEMFFRLLLGELGGLSK